MYKAAVIGYGKSGQAAARVLRRRDDCVIDCYDDNIEGFLPLSAYKDEYNITVVSPGVPLERLPQTPARYTSEVELAYNELKKGDKVLAVTGTNGKSTVTHLAAQILNSAGAKAVACGNIGYSFADAVMDNSQEKEPVIYVVELSSFQTELLTRFRVQGAVITNITPDHLDRYPDMDAYIAAKVRLLDFIDAEGELISPRLPAVADRVVSGLYTVRWLDPRFRDWPLLKDNFIMSFGRYFVDTRRFCLLGDHNLANMAQALALAAVVQPMSGDVTALIEGLTGMPHRTEKVAEYDDITWIDDSKATNADSALIGLKSCNWPTIAMLGGRDKKGDFTILADEINRAVSELILFGEARELIWGQLKDLVQVPVILSPTLKQAVGKAKDIASAGYTVILTPACASFDEFKSYADRGEKFASYVHGLYRGRGLESA